MSWHIDVTRQDAQDNKKIRHTIYDLLKRAGIGRYYSGTLVTTGCAAQKMQHFLLAAL